MEKEEEGKNKKRFFIFKSMLETRALIKAKALELAEALAGDLDLELRDPKTTASEANTFRHGIGALDRNGGRFVILEVDYSNENTSLYFGKISKQNIANPDRRVTIIKTYALNNVIGPKVFQSMVRDAKKWMDDGKPYWEK